MDALLYVRVSTDKQRVDRQIYELRRAADREGWNVIDVVEDPAQSGATLQRPKLLETLVRLDRGEADALAVCHLKRLTRDAVDMGDLLNWFDEAGVRLVSLAQQLDTDLPGARAMALAWAGFAQLEREDGSHATKMGMADLRAKGACIGRPAIADRPELAERIRQMRNEQRMSLRKICEVLNAEGVPTLRGGAVWRPSALQTILEYRRPPRRRQRDVLPPITRRRLRAA
jgi:DNA invertase Pin-like site-specific DNA recombinase